MEDSTMFMQWAMDTLLNEHPAPAIDETTFPSLQALRDASHAVEMVRELLVDDDEAHLANSCSSGDGDVTDGGSGGGNVVPGAPATARNCHGSSRLKSPRSFVRRGPPPLPSGGANLPAVSWNFVTGSAQAGSGGMVEEAAAAAAPRSLPELALGSPPTRRTSPKSSGAASYAPDHIIAERKRREKINKRLIELSTVIPGLKKMDKATILSDAAKYVKELQQRLKDLGEAAAAGSNGRSVKKPCNGGAITAPDENGSPSTTASSSGPPPKPELPEIQARLSEKTAAVRVHCRSSKGVAAAVLAEVEELGLSIVHANAMPFSASTVIITITAKMEEGFAVTAEEIVGRLNSALSHQHSNCNGTEETGN
ncbi:unnamed protein product [Urochloa decumbens]|uniref:BHLH domain-containing protein n=1 Tax=Urochloa decumbens TaxID=240449 RepID=A0ABC8VS53_9POAL